MKPRQVSNKAAIFALLLWTGAPLGFAWEPDSPPIEQPKNPDKPADSEATERDPAEVQPEESQQDELTLLRAERDLLTTHLIEAYRRLFLRLPEAERSQFLAELMLRGYVGVENGNGEHLPTSKTPLLYQIRELAYDLAAAEVVSARPLGPGIVEAAASGLKDPQPSVRRKAAGLLAKIDASPVIAQVIEALGTEPNAAVQRELLTVIARYPRPEARPLALAKVIDENTPREVTVSALETLLALLAQGPALDEEQTEAVHTVLLELSPAEITPNTVRLLAKLGDLNSVRAMLNADRSEIARAAARELVGDADSLEPIITRAQRTDTIYEPAMDAIRRHTPTATGFRRASELPAPSAEKRQEMLTRLAAALPPAELLTVASLPMDLAERERLLATVATDEELAKYAQAEYLTEDRRLLLESLVRTRLQLKNAREALRVIRGLPTEARSSALSQDEISCLIWLNRLDEAAEQTIPLGNSVGPDIWLTTLERIETLDHAPAVLARLLDEFDSSLNDAQRERLGALTERLASLHPPDDPADPDDGQAPPTTETVEGENPGEETEPTASDDAPAQDEPDTISP